MIRKIGMTCVCAVLVLTGCSLINKPGDGQKPDLQTIESKVAFIGSIAFGLEAIQPFRAQICEAIETVSQRLESLQDKNLTKEQLSAFVLAVVNEQLPSGIVADVAKSVVSFILNQTFDYVWSKYADLLEGDSVIIVRGLAGGLSRACTLVVGMSVDNIDTIQLEAELAKIK